MPRVSSSLSALGQRTSEPPISWLIKTTLERPHLISLAAGFTDGPTLPRREAATALQQILRSRGTGRAALQYGSTAGLPALRERIAARLRQADRTAARGRNADAYTPARLVITNGSQQLLYLITEALCDPGDIVLVEDPTYFVYLGIAQSHGLRLGGIRMTGEGIDVEHLAATLERLRRTGELRRVKFLYLVTYHQNPTGVTTSLERKVRALALLRRYEKDAGHRLYLLEDAAYRELHFGGEPVCSALAAGDSDRVIYAGTFSKPFATGVRIGFGLLPTALLGPVLRIKGNHDFGSTSLLQHLLARVLASGDYERHLAVLARRYARKAALMTSALRAHFPASVSWHEPKGGLYVWVSLPGHVPAGPKSRFFARALDRGVLYVPGELCYAEDPARPRPRHELRLSFGGASDDEIRTGIARLGAVAHEFAARTRASANSSRLRS